MEQFMEKILKEVEVMGHRLDRYESQYHDKTESNSRLDTAAAAAACDSVADNQQGADLKFLKDSFANLQNQIQAMHQQMEKIRQRQDDLEQYGRSNCLIVHKCEDVPKTGQYMEHENYICDKLNSLLPLDSPLKATDIDIAHPLPSKKNVAGIPVIVKFLRRNQRNEVYAKKKALKGKALVITESLTRRRLELLETAKETFGWKSAWSWMGEVFVFAGTKKQVIKNLDDIRKIKQASTSYAEAAKSLNNDTTK